MELETTVRVWMEDDVFIAHALPLDVASCGDSAQSARAALREAVELFIHTAREHGTLEALLEECGYRKSGSHWTAPPLLEQGLEVLAV